MEFCHVVKIWKLHFNSIDLEWRIQKGLRLSNLYPRCKHLPTSVIPTGEPPGTRGTAQPELVSKDMLNCAAGFRLQKIYSTENSKVSSYSTSHQKHKQFNIY